MDRSGKVVNLTLWGSEAEAFNGSSCPVIALRGCKVSDFGGRSLTTQFSSLMSVDPDIPEAHQLRGWFDSVGRDKEVSSISDQRSGGTGELSLSLSLSSPTHFPSTYYIGVGNFILSVCLQVRL